MQPLTIQAGLDKISSSDLYLHSSRSNYSQKSPALQNSNIANTKMTVYGFKNLGNSCYLNAILQCLLTIDKFNEFLVTQPDNRLDSSSIVFALSQLFESIWTNSYNDKLLVTFRNKLGMISDDYKNRTEQDAQEFLLFLLNRIDEELQGKPKSQPCINDINMTKVRELFGGLLRTQAVCPFANCKRSSIIETQVKNKKRTSFLKFPYLSSKSKLKKLEEMSNATSTGQSTGENLNQNELFLCLSLPLPHHKHGVSSYSASKQVSPRQISFKRYLKVIVASSQMCSLTLPIASDGNIGDFYQVIWKHIYPSEFYENGPLGTSEELEDGFVYIMLLQVTDWGFGTLFLDSEESISQAFDEPESHLYNNNAASSLPASLASLMSTVPESGLYALKMPVMVPTFRPNEMAPEPSESTVHNFYRDALESAQKSLQLVMVNALRETSPNDNFTRFSAPCAVTVERMTSFARLKTLVFRKIAAACRLNNHELLSYLTHKYNFSSRSRPGQRTSQLCEEDDDICWPEVPLTYWIVDAGPGEMNELDPNDQDLEFPLLHTTVEAASVQLPFDLMQIPDKSKQNHLRVYTKFCQRELPFPKILRLVVLWPRIHTVTARVLQCLQLFQSQAECSPHDDHQDEPDEPMQPRHDEDGSSITLDDCLTAYTAAQTLEDCGSWKCPKCHQSSKHVQVQTRITHLPSVLILHLTRFHHLESDATTNKLTMLVDFPIAGLDMKKYLTRDECEQQTSPSESWIYDLTAVCNHDGDLHSGHYTAYCLNQLDGQWRSFNDTRVSKLDKNQIVQANAYMLVYQLRSHLQKCTFASEHWSMALSPRGEVWSAATSNASSPAHSTGSNEVSPRRAIPVSLPANQHTRSVMNSHALPPKQSSYQPKTTGYIYAPSQGSVRHVPENMRKSMPPVNVTTIPMYEDEYDDVGYRVGPRTSVLTLRDVIYDDHHQRRSRVPLSPPQSTNSSYHRRQQAQQLHHNHDIPSRNYQQSPTGDPYRSSSNSRDW